MRPRCSAILGSTIAFLKRFQLRQRAFFVGPYQAARAGDIRRQDSRQSPLYMIAAQGCTPDAAAVDELADERGEALLIVRRHAVLVAECKTREPANIRGSASPNVTQGDCNQRSAKVAAGGTHLLAHS